MSKFSLDLIVIDNDLEALALRSALEWWGVKVNLYIIGKAQDVVDFFQSGQLAPYICIAGHGDGDAASPNWSFVLPELGEEIAKKQPYDKFLHPADIAEFAKLSGQHIFSNACQTGHLEMANVFLSAGAASYVAPQKAPFGNATLHFALNFYYWQFAKEKDVNEAFEKALSQIDIEQDKFTLFQH